MVVGVFLVFLAKPTCLYINLDSHQINNYGETNVPSLTFSMKRAMICEFFEPNSQNSCVMLDCSVSLVSRNFWSHVDPVVLLTSGLSWRTCELITPVLA